MTRPITGSRRRVVAVFLACALAALAACSDGEQAAAPTPTPTATASADVAGRFDVGGGRMLQITCAGSGEPTILLEAGGGSSSSDYPFAVRSALAAKTRTCTYDRAGLGASDPPPYRRRLMVDVVTDLDHLLTAAGIKGKLLLVGASFGGLVMLDLALTHSERTAGLVVLDTDWPTTDPQKSPDKMITPAQRAEYIRLDAWDNGPNVERIDYQATTGEVERRVHPDARHAQRQRHRREELRLRGARRSRLHAQRRRGHPVAAAVAAAEPDSHAARGRHVPRPGRGGPRRGGVGDPLGTGRRHVVTETAGP
jgi:pimeloyl-ACP methyl ester carboxylesterase